MHTSYSRRDPSGSMDGADCADRDIGREGDGIIDRPDVECSVCCRVADCCRAEGSKLNYV